MAAARSTRLALSTLVLAGALSLAGCAGTDGADILVGPSATTPQTSASASASASPSPSASPSVKPNGTPVNLGCEQILTLQNVYDFNPNYAADPNAKTPESARTLTEIGGRNCGWVNLTSKDTFTVTVAQPDEPTLAAAKANAASAGGATDVYGADGFFTSSGGVGTATVFRNGYWIQLSSAGFFEAADAAQLAEMVISNLG